VEAKIAAGESPKSLQFSVLKGIMEKHGSVVFGGDGYSKEWHHMAVEERGLEDLHPTQMPTLSVLQTP